MLIKVQATCSCGHKFDAEASIRQHMVACPKCRQAVILVDGQKHQAFEKMRYSDEFCLKSSLTPAAKEIRGGKHEG